MASWPRSQREVGLPRRLRPFHRFSKPLAWVWGGIFLGVFTSVGSSWLITKSFDPTGTPLGWLASHPWITLPSLFLLGLLTLLARLASSQEQDSASAFTLTLTPKLRLQLIGEFDKEYSRLLASSLQGQVTLKLDLQERTDVTAPSASLVFQRLESGILIL